MTLDVIFEEKERKFNCVIQEERKDFSPQFGEIQTVTKYIGGEKYEGEYIVTPKVVEQMMPTKDKVLTDNVVVKSIPIYRVTNQTGGTTIYIAKEI